MTKGDHDSHKMLGSLWLAPLLLTLQAPITILLLTIVCTKYDGSFAQWFQGLSIERFISELPRPGPEGFKIFFAFAAFEFLLLYLLPGKVYEGPTSPQGNRPKYTLNGVSAFFLTHIAFVLAVYFKIFPAGIVYDNFGVLLSSTSAFSLVFVFLLNLKGRFYPSTTDVVFSGSFLFDFWEGVELYPTFLGVSLKQIVNCRIGMMGWSVIITSFAGKQFELYGYVSNSTIVSLVLQQLYIFKFFLWEGGYFKSIDIMHDRFGFMICWGCLCWIAGVYTSTSLYLVNHPIQLDNLFALAIIALGALTIWIQYDADYQRQYVRDTNGKCKIWGKEPKTILAKYKTEDNKEHTNLLLTSGWWGVARHFHYLLELSMTFLWSLPALFSHYLPWFYLTFLTFLLFDRSTRDEKRCSKKYGTYWQKYCAIVPYRIVPYIY